MGQKLPMYKLPCGMLACGITIKDDDDHHSTQIMESVRAHDSAIIMGAIYTRCLQHCESDNFLKA